MVPVQRFKRSINLSLFDQDTPDSDDLLGTVHFTRRLAGRGVRTARFTQDGADYTLTYKVV